MSNKLSIPTTNNRKVYTLNDFSGGLCNNVNETKLKSNTSPDLCNMSFYKDGLMQTRPGFKYLEKKPSVVVNPTFDFSEIALIERIFVRESDGVYESFIIISRSGSVDIRGIHFKIRPDDWGNTSDVYGHVIHDNKFYFTFGNNIYYVSLQTPYKLVKVVAPPEDYTPLPKPATQGKFGYRDDDSLMHTQWYEPCEYELEDGYKGTPIYPEQPRLLASKDDRLYVTDKKKQDMIFISDVLNPYYYPASLPVLLPPMNDDVTSMCEFNNCLMIGRNRDIFTLYGNTNRADNVEQYRLTRLDVHTGIINNNCWSIIENCLYYMGSDYNLYKVSSTSSSQGMLSNKINLFVDFAKHPYNLNFFKLPQAKRNEIMCYFDEEKNELFIKFHSAGDTLETYAVLNFLTNSWSCYKVTNANTKGMFYFRDGVRFYCVNGHIYMFERTCYHDESYRGYVVNNEYIEGVYKFPINAYWKSRQLDMLEPARIKQFRDSYVTVGRIDDEPLTVYCNYDVDYSQAVNRFIIKDERGIWDESLWDESKFTGKELLRSLPIVVGRRGRGMTVTIGSNSPYAIYQGFPNELEIAKLDDYTYFFTEEPYGCYIKVPLFKVDGVNRRWKPVMEDTFDQPFRLHEVASIYEFKGYR